jgi:hypothetical protein
MGQAIVIASIFEVTGAITLGSGESARDALCPQILSHIFKLFCIC